jgi:protein tyrosine phosphatase (PTP) superfamily phosphohydrolase (DUF442 family)/chloramphenicol 3-O-phosphotransferase
MPIFLLSGAPGAGKSTTAEALLRRFPFGLRIPVDDLREWVVSGIAHPVPSYTAETGRQFRLARAAAADTARLYADAGFVVAIDDVLHESDAEACFVVALTPRPVYKALLQPPLEIALARNQTRANKPFDPASLAETIRGVHRSLGEQNRADLGWIVVDNAALTPDQTADAILEAALCGIRNYRRLAPDLITGGQPTAAQLACAAATGVQAVVNLALHDAPYALPDERATVEGLGMTYEHIPVIWERPTAADLAAFFEALDRLAGRRVLVHCAANYRASAFILLYRVLRLGWPLDRAWPDLRAIWNPAEYPVWQEFLAEHCPAAGS